MTTSTVSILHPQELSERLQKNDILTLVDVRTPAEYRAKHVRGAINMPLYELEKANVMELKELPGDLIFICAAGQRSEMACDRALKDGCETVWSVQGGTEACESAGLELERARGAISIDRQVRIIAGGLALIGSLLSLVYPVALALPIIMGAGLAFAGLSNTCGMAQVLARMPWNN